MAKTLTQTVVEKTAPPKTGRLEIPDALVPGFVLRITENGARSFVVRTRVKGKQIRLTIGDAAMGLARARELARDELQKAAAGIDPRELKRLARIEATRKQDLDFESVVAVFLEKHHGLKPGQEPSEGTAYAKDTRSLFAEHISPHLKLRLLTEVTKADIVKVIDRIESGVSPYRANRALAAIRKLFNWAVDRGLITTSPITAGMARKGEESRDRFFTLDEIRVFWKATGELDDVWRDFFRVALLTGQRRGEIMTMRWDCLDIDGERMWTIDADDTKADRRQLVPLAETVRDILRARPILGPSVFTTRGDVPIAAFTKATDALDAAMRMVCEKEGRKPIEDWRIHDLRRSCATHMQDACGVPESVISAVLNHSAKARLGVTAVYARGDLTFAKRKALTSFARLCTLVADDDLCPMVAAILSPKDESEATRTDEFRRLIQADAPAWNSFVEGLRQPDTANVVRLERADA